MIFYLIIFLFGLCVGSLLNAVIYRLEKGESVIKVKTENEKVKAARSYCPHCKHVLAWYDLVPVLSFLLLRGRCRYCHEKISWQYPIVEMVTGLLFLLIFNFFTFVQGFGGQVIFNFQLVPNSQFPIPNSIISLLFWFYIASSMIIIFVYDLKYYLIPDKIIFPAIVISAVYRLFGILDFGNCNLFGNWKLIIENSSGLLEYILAAVLASGFFLSLIIISKGRWMGMGDVKLAFLMGLILGWPNILVALFSAFLSGTAVGLSLIFGSSVAGHRRSVTLKSQIPFGPFLIAGTFIAMFWGQMIVEWYLGLLF